MLNTETMIARQVLGLPGCLAEAVSGFGTVNECLANQCLCQRCVS